MVHAVEEEVEHECEWAIREVLLNVEQEPVQRVLEDLLQRTISDDCKRAVLIENDLQSR